MPHELLVVGKFSKFLLLIKFVFYLFIYFFSCAIWLLKKHPPPSFSIQRREMNGNKIFSCHHPFFGLVQATPFCLKKVVCERMTPPSPLPSVTPTPRPHPPSLPPPSRLTHLLSLRLSAYTCLFECRWHKKTFIATKYICFSILSVAPSRRHLWHAHCTGLYRSSVD